MSDCGKYLILTPHEGCAPVNRLFYCDLENQKEGIKGKISSLLQPLLLWRNYQTWQIA